MNTLVIGGGVAGLAALAELAAAGVRPLTLIEGERLGHARGSSHGASRIARSTYPDALYARLMRTAFQEDWPRLEARAGVQLLHRADMCLFGPPDGAFDAYARAVADAEVPVERIDAAEARRRFPELRFDGTTGALHDRTAAIVDAAGTLAALARVAVERGATILDDTRCTALELTSDPLRIVTSRGLLSAERVVIAAGGWSDRLVSELAGLTKVLRQRVGYFRYAGASELGRFAPWAWLGPGENGIHYGLPAFGGEGIKAARHRTSGPADDPDAELADGTIELAELRATLSDLLARELGPCLRSETCLYTMVPREDFVLSLHPRDSRIAIGAGFSGHGFKFAPLLGRALANLALHGRTGVEELDSARERFTLAPTRNGGETVPA